MGQTNEEVLPHAKGSETSKAAAESQKGGGAQRDRERVLAAIIRAGIPGMTTDEVEVALRGRHQTISARVNGLHNDGLIVDSGGRRPTRSGRQAVVYIGAEFAAPGFTAPESRRKTPKPSDEDLRDTLTLMRTFYRTVRDGTGTAPPESFVRVMRWLASHVKEKRDG
jgi:hypothetical protein